MTEPYFKNLSTTLYVGDCLDILPALPDASVDAIVTDPPYGLADHPPTVIAETLTAWLTGDRAHVPTGKGFMGRSWDSFVPPPAVWDECLRVLKPGGHLVAFAGARTADLLGLSIRLAGFDIRDTINCSVGTLAWYYGSGFPKSKAVSSDPLFCQCMPDLRDTVTAEAAQSAAEVLLANLRRSGKEDASHISHLHGLSVAIHPDYAIPGRTEQDMLPTMRSLGEQPGPSGGSARSDEDGHHGVRSVRHDVRAAAGMAEAGGVADVFAPVRGEIAVGRSQTEGAHEGDRPSRGSGAEGQAPCGAGRGEKPGVEGRSDVQAAEGELHRPQVRQVSSGVASDGQVGRLHHGAPPGDGPLDRPAPAPVGGREPQGPQPAKQCQSESGAVSLERGSQARRGWPLCGRCGKPSLPAGLGTALKPAWEPIIVARKPLAGTVAATVLQHGTGALNIAGCRVGDTVRTNQAGGASSLQRVSRVEQGYRTTVTQSVGEASTVAGRWPTNVILSHPPVIGLDGEPIGDACADGCVSGCPVAELDRQSGTRTSGTGAVRTKVGSFLEHGGLGKPGDVQVTYGDTGGASRFFPAFRYQAKAPKRERPRLADGTAHPTVKPLALMQWLIRLVTSPGGVVLDPFVGSGTTLEAASREGFSSIGIDENPSYADLTVMRLKGKDDDGVRNMREGG